MHATLCTGMYVDNAVHWTALHIQPLSQMVYLHSHGPHLPIRMHNVHKAAWFSSVCIHKGRLRSLYVPFGESCVDAN